MYLLGASAGKAGFKGSKKSTPYAGGKTMEDVLTRIKDRGLQEVDIFIKGIGSGRESAIRALQGSGLTVLTIKDRTPITAWWRSTKESTPRIGWPRIF
jgi:small subunit ribosomal protein S11